MCKASKKAICMLVRLWSSKPCGIIKQLELSISVSLFIELSAYSSPLKHWRSHLLTAMIVWSEGDGWLLVALLDKDRDKKEISLLRVLKVQGFGRATLLGKDRILRRKAGYFGLGIFLEALFLSLFDESLLARVSSMSTTSKGDRGTQL